MRSVASGATALSKAVLRPGRLARSLYTKNGRPLQFDGDFLKGGRRRSVPLPEELAPIIAEWSAGKGPDDLLFASPEGKRLNNSNWRRIVGWADACAGRRVQHLRHTAATFWLGSGIDVKTVQQWLGHASAQLTLNLYSHWLGSGAEAAAIARVNAALSQGSARQFLRITRALRNTGFIE